MCQSKAEGGRRCAFHLSKDVGAAMVAYTAAMTGMTNAAVKGAHDDLVAEGANLPAPEQREVDAFLEQQAFRVRTEPTLTESKREAILRRLRAAIGRVTPSGATFHAWKNVVAESWARSRRRVAAAFLVSVAFTAGGCAAGSNAQPSTPTASPSVSVSASATPAPSPTQTVTVAANISSPEVDAKTKKDFGAEQVTEAWKYSTGLSSKYAFNPTLMNKTPDQVTAADFTEIRANMTPDAQKDWDAMVVGLPAEKATAGVNGIALQGMNVSGYKMNMANPITDFEIDGSVSTSEGKLLTTTQRQRAVVHAIDPSGAPVKFTMTKTLTFYLKPTKAGGWQIDGWKGTGSNSDVTPDN